MCLHFVQQETEILLVHSISGTVETLCLMWGNYFVCVFTVRQSSPWGDKQPHTPKNWKSWKTPTFFIGSELTFVDVLSEISISDSLCTMLVVMLFIYLFFHGRVTKILFRTSRIVKLWHHSPLLYLCIIHCSYHFYFSCSWHYGNSKCIKYTVQWARL